MPRPVTLRQIEVFKAIVEQGTVSRAAEILNISQPSASKALMYFETDSGLRLFDRQKGRLIPTDEAMRLYAEIDRIFAGIRQVENAIARVRRDDKGQLAVGILPALSDAFIERVTTAFRVRNPNLFFSFHTSASRWVAEHILTRELDVGLISSRIDNPSLAVEPLFEHSLVCVMPIGHPLAEREIIRPENLNGIPFVSLTPEVYTGHKVAKIFEKYQVNPEVVLTTATSHTVRQFVAAGYGVSLLHPLFIVGAEDRVVARPFEPEILLDLLLCFARDTRKADLIGEFAAETKLVGERLMEGIMKGLV
ncbi:LysR substrate-binding domain-containing protein [Paracoccus pantotrophus]|uniref:LysR substrate-binding domain-containing protein n=1 Tax=Paracoccus pantotrophus TaxID=82367 RepID=UPI0008E1AFEB|nr:LysR substrate-binding domain-containing protein [Paracoccus pantotrophus]MDF3855777.1 LysR substrate-binding domain-containing protein [Paracoccus pantotrophus]SFP28345.1 DNA-binding transcriptional regulator, LysR family [Paracoccus pantotrophus]